MHKENFTEAQHSLSQNPRLWLLLPCSGSRIGAKQATEPKSFPSDLLPNRFAVHCPDSPPTIRRAVGRPALCPEIGRAHV